MTTEIHLTDWEALTNELQRFGATGEVTTTADRIRVDFGSAYIEVRKEGTISTGMPLHELECDGDIVLVVNNEAGFITVKTDSLEYTFRRP